MVPGYDFSSTAVTYLKLASKRSLFSRSSRGQNLKSRCWQGHSRSKVSRGRLSMPLPGFQWLSAIFGILWLLATSLPSLLP